MVAILMPFNFTEVGATGIGSDPVMLFIIVAGILCLGFMTYAILMFSNR